MAETKEKKQPNKKNKPRLKELYQKEVIPKMMQQFSMKNSMQVPRLKKVTLNIGEGEGSRDAKALESAEKDLATISGQKPVLTRAKKSIAGFKIRAGVPVGVKVTLRGDMMYEFIDRFLSTAIPRMRDFRGLSRKSFDRFGNYSMGIDEQLIFPEIDYDKIDRVRGMDITITTDAKDSKKAEALFEYLGFPFKEKKS